MSAMPAQVRSRFADRPGTSTLHELLMLLLLQGCLHRLTSHSELRVFGRPGLYDLLREDMLPAELAVHARRRASGGSATEPTVPGLRQHLHLGEQLSRAERQRLNKLWTTFPQSVRFLLMALPRAKLLNRLVVDASLSVPVA